jgi:hypothetical protein
MNIIYSYSFPSSWRVDLSNFKCGVFRKSVYIAYVVANLGYEEISNIVIFV